jgi:hypothetical protein
MKQALINLFTITPKKSAFLQGLFVGLFVTMGIFNVADGFFFSKNIWQLNCGVYQILVGALIFKA